MSNIALCSDTSGSSVVCASFTFILNQWKSERILPYSSKAHKALHGAQETCSLQDFKIASKLVIIHSGSHYSLKFSLILETVL